MKIKHLVLGLLAYFMLSFSAFSEPLTPETTLAKTCFKYYQNKYLSAKSTKVFIYARDKKSGKDRCVMHHGEGSTDSIIKAAMKTCVDLHKLSKCKVVSINDNWMVQEGDFTAITQPDDTALSEAQIDALVEQSNSMLKGSCVSFFKKHLSYSGHKSFAYALDEKEHVSCSQNSSYSVLKISTKNVIDSCEKYRKSQGDKGATTPCKLFSVNNKIVAKPADYAKALKAINNQSIDIFQLAKTGVPKELKKALKSGIDVNIQDKFGSTPLLRAIGANRLDNVKFLVENGADIQIKENLGFDAFNTAVYSRFNNMKIIQYLLEKGADVNTKTKRPGDSPLHNAAFLGRLNVVKWLLEKDVDVNVKNNFTETALHKAADQGHVKILALLLEKGAKLNEKTRRGITPLDEALFRKRKKAIEFLKSKDAKSNNPHHE